MYLLNYFYLILTAYLLGSIPTSVWIGKIFYHTDVREYGSKNAGTTNTIRTLGYKAGIPVFLIDVLKGFFASNLIIFITNHQLSEVQLINLQIVLGFASIIGHIFPIFAKFKGGKGVATLLGVFLAIATYPTLLAFTVFVIVLVISKYVSISSIIAGITFPVFVYFTQNTNSPVLQITSIIISILLIITHRKNIQRLLKGEEHKFNFSNK